MQLNDFGVIELTSTEMQDVDGGIIWIIVGAVVINMLTATPAY